MSNAENRTFSTDAAAMETEFRAALHKIAHDTRFTDVSFRDVVNFIAKTAGEVLDCPGRRMGGRRAARQRPISAFAYPMEPGIRSDR